MFYDLPREARGICINIWFFEIRFIKSNPVCAEVKPKLIKFTIGKPYSSLHPQIVKAPNSFFKSHTLTRTPSMMKTTPVFIILVIISLTASRDQIVITSHSERRVLPTDSTEPTRASGIVSSSLSSYCFYHTQNLTMLILPLQAGVRNVSNKKLRHEPDKCPPDHPCPRGGKCCEGLPRSGKRLVCGIRLKSCINLWYIRGVRRPCHQALWDKNCLQYILIKNIEYSSFFTFTSKDCICLLVSNDHFTC